MKHRAAPSSFHGRRRGELGRLRSPWAAWVQLVVMAFWTLQPLPVSHADYTTFDGYDANGDPIFTNHADNEGPDSDGDGLHDGFETYVSSTNPAQWDSDNDGFADGDEWRGFSGVNYASYTLRNNGTTPTLPYYADVDQDGIRNDLDAYPLDAQDGLGDPDGDGAIDMFDSYPDDYWNGNPPPPSTVTWGDFTKWVNGTETWFSSQTLESSQWSDSDGDGIPDAADPYAWDASNNTTWWSATAYVDGIEQSFSAVFATSWGYGNDGDGDGLPDAWDAYLYDATNNTSWWQGGSHLINGTPTAFSPWAYASTSPYADSDSDLIPDALDPYVWFAGNSEAGWRASVLASNPFDGTAPAYVTPELWLQKWFAEPGTQRGVPLYLTGSSLPDGDGDGIPDALETFFGLNPADWSDAYAHADGSGYSYGERYRAGQDLRDPGDLLQEWQGDFIPNVWKLRHGFSLTDPSVAFADPDNDQTVNLLEHLMGTDPLTADIAPEEGAILAAYLQSLLAMAGGGAGAGGQGGGAAAPPDIWSLDTDGDGLKDAEELARRTNPAKVDTDQDGLSDGEEVHDHGTDPRKADTDGGGVGDGEEVGRGTNPNFYWDDLLPETVSEIAFEDVDWEGYTANIVLRGGSSLAYLAGSGEGTVSGELILELFAAGQSSGGTLVESKSVGGVTLPSRIPVSLGGSETLTTLLQGGHLLATFTPTGNGNPVSATLTLSLTPVEIVVKKKGGEAVPSEGICVTKGDTLVYELVGLTDELKQTLASSATWNYRKLRGDGTLDGWKSFGTKGTKIENVETNAGIYQIKAVLDGGGEVQYKRWEDAPDATSNKTGIYNEVFRKGRPDYVGVVDNASRLAVWRQARSSLGSPDYAVTKSITCGFGVDPAINFLGEWKCNVFVFVEPNLAGVNVPTKIWPDWTPGIPPYVDRAVPPEADEWADTSFSIAGWTWNSSYYWPQPGDVVAGNGHCGILDYDGAWISAGKDTINKSMHLTTDSDFNPSFRNP